MKAETYIFALPKGRAFCGVIRADTSDKDSHHGKTSPGAFPCVRTCSLQYGMKMRLNGEKEIGQCVFVSPVGTFFAALSSSRVSVCFVLWRRRVYAFSSESGWLPPWACREHPVRPLRLCFVACPFFFPQDEVESKAVWGNHLLVSRCCEHWFSKLLDKKQSTSMQS